MESMDIVQMEPLQLSHGITTDSIANIASTLTNEEKEKEKRQLNLILHNVKESFSQESFE